MSTKPVITLHWLEASRAQRIAWLLEELGLEWKIKLYHRDKTTKQAPEELKKIHPLGKSPVLEVDYQDGNPSKVIAESGNIIRYIVKHFDKEQKLTPKTEEECDDVQYYLHLAEGTLQPYLTLATISKVLEGYVPDQMSSAVAGYNDNILIGSYTVPQVKRVIDMLEDTLQTNAEAISSEGDTQLFFVGNMLTGADVILAFSVDLAFTRKPFAQKIDQDTSHDFLRKWLNQIKSRPAYKHATEKVDYYGQGKYLVNINS